MTTYVKGNPVANATSYELFEKVNGSYNSLATANEINFDLSTINFEAGEHSLVVKAKADGYEDSDYSNEVAYTVESGGGTNVDLNIQTTDQSIMAKHTASLLGDEGEVITATDGGAHQIVSDYITIPDNCYISEFAALSQRTTANNRYYCAFYDENKNFISGILPIPNSDNDYAVAGPWYCRVIPPTIPSSAKYMRVGFNTVLVEPTNSGLNNITDSIARETVANRKYALVTFAQ